MTKAWLICDGQWGSTGKGLMAGYLALTRNPDTAVCNFGPNAGHTTVLDDGREVVVQMLPSAIVSPSVKNVLIGPGAIVDPIILYEEMEKYSDLLKGKMVYVHESAAIVNDVHKYVEKHKLDRISSTCKGAGAAQSDKIMRIGGCVAKEFHKSLGANVSVISVMEFTDMLLKSKALQIESAQGLELGINSGGWYPYCTGRDVNVHQVLSDCGVPYCMEKPEVIVTMRTFPIRVGDAFDKYGNKVGTSGPVYEDMKETSWEELKLKEERTTVTKKIRRVFTFSMSNLDKVIKILHPDGIFLNFTNYLDNNPEFGTGKTGDLINIIDDKWRSIKGNSDHVVKWIGVGPMIKDVHPRREVDYIDEGN